MTNDTQPSALAPRFAHWRALILVGCSIGSGLVLDMIVLGSGPERPVEAVAALPTTVVTIGDNTTTVPLAAAATTVAASVVPSTVPTIAAAGIAVVQTPLPASSASVSPSPIPAAAAPKATAPPPAAPSTVVPPAPAPPTTPPTAAPTSTAPAAPSGPPSTSPPATAPEAVVSVSYPSYPIPNVGDVVLAFTDENTVTLWSVAPSANWVYEVEHDGPRSVEIKFFNVQTHNEAEFHAEIEGYRIKVEYGD